MCVPADPQQLEPDDAGEQEYTWTREYAFDEARTLEAQRTYVFMLREDAALYIPVRSTLKVNPKRKRSDFAHVPVPRKVRTSRCRGFRIWCGYLGRAVW